MLIVNELKSFQNKITLNYTYECQERKDIYTILILISYNIPVARKIYGYVSALVSYYQYEKKANYKNQQYNFAEINDLEKQFYI